MRPGPGDSKHLRLEYECELQRERFDHVIKLIKEGKENGVDLVNLKTRLNERMGLSEEPQLVWAIKNGYFRIAKFLLFQQIDLEAKDSKGETALMAAAALKTYTIAEEDDLLMVMGFLLAQANRYSRDRFGNTALHIAAMNGRIERVRLMLDHGIDVSQSNMMNQKAIDLVPASRTELTEMLQHAAVKK